jgi:hypothetical protein
MWLLHPLDAKCYERTATVGALCAMIANLTTDFTVSEDKNGVNVSSFTYLAQLSCYNILFIGFGGSYFNIRF